MHHPELLCTRADILWKQGKVSPEELENGYREAIEASRQIGTIAQELRTATRLGRLLQSQGRVQEAYALLAPLYAQFTEGLDTLDLQEARALLNQLSVTLSSEKEI